MTEKNQRLADCNITFHLINGQTVTQSYKKDVPSLLWDSIKEDFLSIQETFEVEPENFLKVLLPKANILYITLKVLESS